MERRPLDPDPAISDHSPQIHQHEVRASPSTILPLPAEVISQIKSSATITSLAGVVLSLMQNSIDAEAQRITIDVDFARGSCVVEDDGVGIPPHEFMGNGGLGKLYRKSVKICYRNKTLSQPNWLPFRLPVP